MNVCYNGFWGTYSGMGEAARNIIVALHEAGVEVSTELVPNIVSEQNLGPAYKLCQKLQNRTLDYNVKIIHTTPDLVTKYMEPLKYHVFHLFWETDKLPKWWVWALNLVDEIWTGSEWSKKVFQESGVKKPIWVCPQPVDTDLPQFEPFRLPGVTDDLYIFYSIFQWIERKDPRSLLKTYWNTFKPDDQVLLLLKTYREKFTTEERNAIIKEIKSLKEELGMKAVAPVQIYTELMSRGDIYRLHQTGDCFVSAHRGEGWGIPIAEAMAFGKPVISTNLGGIHEHVPPHAALFTKYNKKPVFNMDFVPWYDKDQLWAEVDSEDLKEKMRFVFDNREEAKKIGALGKDVVTRSLSYKTVGEQMLARLQQIEERL